jgi:hypothetical protein
MRMTLVTHNRSGGPAGSEKLSIASRTVSI